MSSKKFKPIKEYKQRLNVTIDASLMKMLEDIMEGFEINISLATNEVLEYFKDEIWDKGVIAKTIAEEEALEKMEKLEEKLKQSKTKSEVGKG